MADFQKAIPLLSEELTDSSLRLIEQLFTTHGISLGVAEPSTDPGQRRGLMRSYLASVDWGRAEDRAKMLGVLSETLRNIALRPNEGRERKWIITLRGAGFEVDPSDYIVTEPRPPASVVITPEALASLPDPTAILDHLTRLGGTVEKDPRLAISTAKALIESTAKLVLTARRVPYDSVENAPALAARAQESLGLAAKGIGEEHAPIRRVLSALSSAALGVVETRNKVGVDHGAESVPAWVRPRHARLVVGAAHVWCQTMLETLGDPDAPWRTRKDP